MALGIEGCRGEGLEFRFEVLGFRVMVLGLGFRV